VAAPICVARIGAAHGVRGAVKLWTFTEDPLAVTRYEILMDRCGFWRVARVHAGPGHLVATLGISTRGKPNVSTASNLMSRAKTA
jgi:16S rRNA processing protein RimM